MLLRPFVALARALTRAAGPSALLRAAPPLAALGLMSTILFAGYGMSARDLTALLGASAVARAALWTAWILLLAPAARALLTAPTTFVFRALPAPLAWFHLVHGAHLLVLQAPWMLLFLRGAGPLAALAAGLAATAASALFVARVRAPVDLVAALLLAAAILLAAPPLLLLPVALFAAAVGLAAAFARAPERPAPAAAASIADGGAPVGHPVAFPPQAPGTRPNLPPPHTPPIRGAAPLALALTHAVVLARRDASTLARGAAVAVAGALIAALAARNNALTARADQEMAALAAGGIPLALATGGVAGRVLATERGLDWLLLSSAASVRLRALVAVAVTAAWGALAGSIHGGLAALLVAPDAPRRLRIALFGLALGASLAAVAAHLARRAERSAGVDGTTVVVGMAVAGALATGLAAWIGALALAPIAALALLLAASAVPVLARRERVSEHVTRAAWEVE